MDRSYWENMTKEQLLNELYDSFSELEKKQLYIIKLENKVEVLKK